MERKGKLQLDLFDVHGDRIAGMVDINLRHQVLAHNPVASVDASRRILIRKLHGAPQGLYRLEVDPPAYLPVSRFVNLEAEEATAVELTFAVDPKKVKRVDFPKFEDLPPEVRALLAASVEVFGFNGLEGKELYNALDDVRRAGLLNIAAKTRSTPLANGRTVFPYISKLLELRGDRFFAFVSKELREETKHSATAGLFHPVDSSLHHLPAGFSDYTRAGSFKTDDSYGNLQLTFFMRGDDCVADIDIDDASGLAHLFQVLRNHLSGRPTHPYDIHQILVHHQHLDPGYRLVV